MKKQIPESVPVVPSSGITILIQEIPAIYKTEGRRRVCSCAIFIHSAKDSSKHNNILEAPLLF